MLLSLVLFCGASSLSLLYTDVLAYTTLPNPPGLLGFDDESGNGANQGQWSGRLNQGHGPWAVEHLVGETHPSARTSHPSCRPSSAFQTFRLAGAPSLCLVYCAIVHEAVLCPVLVDIRLDRSRCCIESQQIAEDCLHLFRWFFLRTISVLDHLHTWYGCTDYLNAIQPGLRSTEHGVPSQRKHVQSLYRVLRTGGT